MNPWKLYSTSLPPSLLVYLSIHLRLTLTKETWNSNGDETLAFLFCSPPQLNFPPKLLSSEIFNCSSASACSLLLQNQHHFQGTALGYTRILISYVFKLLTSNYIIFFTERQKLLVHGENNNQLLISRIH